MVDLLGVCGLRDAEARSLASQPRILRVPAAGWVGDGEPVRPGGYGVVRLRSGLVTGGERAVIEDGLGTGDVFRVSVRSKWVDGHGGLPVTGKLERREGLRAG
jgi:hypothetical protein